MGVVGLDHQESCVTESQQLVVEARAVDDHVGEAAPVPVASLDVGFETHRAAFEAGLRVRRGFGTEAFHRLAGIVRLGRVDPEQTNGVVAPAGPGHMNGVAVDRTGHGVARVGRTSSRSEKPPRDRGGGKDRHDDGPGSDHDGTLPTGCDTAAGGAGLQGPAFRVNRSRRCHQ